MSIYLMSVCVFISTGHALLEENFIDFTNVILKSSVFAMPTDPLLASLPTKEDMLDVEKQVEIAIFMMWQY